VVGTCDSKSRSVSALAPIAQGYSVCHKSSMSARLADANCVLREFIGYAHLSG
jgi:hypothetical protein